MAGATANVSGPYGVLELRKLYPKNVVRALIIAAAIHFMAIGSYYVIQWLKSEDEPVYSARVVMKYSDLGPPPSLSSSAAAPAVSVAGPQAKPTVGTPVPVPDAEISPEATIATQTEMANQVGSADVAGSGTGGTPEIQNDVVITDDAPPADFVPVEKQPVPIKNPPPQYPEIARRAGVEGTVWVKIWVDKEGKAKKAQVIKSDAELFNQNAIDAAMQWTFTPAVMNNGPVSVWVSIPFKFKLNQAR
ncbi:MAG TPA: energy transducer TonB [Bacteroidota bacterium]|nr:energy transducer TonB [Bacteroidota bacterium]